MRNPYSPTKPSNEFCVARTLLSAAVDADFGYKTTTGIPTCTVYGFGL